VHIISQIEDEKLQPEARVALQEHDRQMDKAMQMVEDGKRLVSEGRVQSRMRIKMLLLC
jgi:hypothetical protein